LSAKSSPRVSGHEKDGEENGNEEVEIDYSDADEVLAQELISSLQKAPLWDSLNSTPTLSSSSSSSPNEGVSVTPSATSDSPSPSISETETKESPPDRVSTFREYFDRIPLKKKISWKL